MGGLLTFEADVVPDAPRERRGWAVPAWVGGLALLLLAGLAIVVADNGYQARVIDELVAKTVGEAGGLRLNFLDSFGQAVTIAVLFVLHRLPGVTTDAFPALTCVAAAAFLAGLARLLDRQGWPALQIFGVSVAVSLNPLFLKAATVGTTALLGGLAFFAVVYTCERLEHIGDVQAQMNAGLVLAMTGVVDPAAVYIIMPVLTLMPVLYRNIESAAAAWAAYLMVLLPLLTVVASFVFLHLIFSPDPLVRPFQLWASPLHGAIDVIEHHDWPLVFGGDFLRPAGVLALGVLVCVPGTIVLIWRFWRSRAERASPGTATVALVVPVLAGALATSQVHARSAWPFLLAALMGVLVWLATKPIPRTVRRTAVAALAAGAAVSWVFPPLWAERGAAAWRTALLREVPPPAHWPETPATQSWFTPALGLRLVPPPGPAPPGHRASAGVTSRRK